jgi:hypothetical protein
VFEFEQVSGQLSTSAQCGALWRRLSY